MSHREGIFWFDYVKGALCALLVGHIDFRKSPNVSTTEVFHASGRVCPFHRDARHAVFGYNHSGFTTFDRIFCGFKIHGRILGWSIWHHVGLDAVDLLAHSRGLI